MWKRVTFVLIAAAAVSAAVADDDWVAAVDGREVKAIPSSILLDPAGHVARFKIWARMHDSETEDVTALYGFDCTTQPERMWILQSALYERATGVLIGQHGPDSKGWLYVSPNTFGEWLAGLCHADSGQLRR